MAVTTIPNVTNWSVTPQNGQANYFTLMNTWLSESTSVIASLQTAITAQNVANGEINALAIQTENNATIATSLANFQGAWSNAITYSKGQSVESTTGSKIYYISKVDNNLNHIVTDTNYWLPNPINDKLDKDFSILTDKSTPIDSDIFVMRETGGLLKKLSWANFKATLFDFSFSYGVSGYIKLPTLLGGFIFEWGAAVISGATPTVVTLPLAFPNSIFFANAIRSSATAVAANLSACSIALTSQSQITIAPESTSTGSKTFYYMAMGR